MTKRQSDRSMIARAAAHSLHAQRDPKETTAAARKAAEDRWEKLVDPDGVLDPKERSRRAEAAKKAWFSKLGRLSGKARRKKKALVLVIVAGLGGLGGAHEAFSSSWRKTPISRTGAETTRRCRSRGSPARGARPGDEQRRHASRRCAHGRQRRYAK